MAKSEAGDKKTVYNELPWRRRQRASCPVYHGNVVHEVHSRFVGLGVHELEERGHSEANGTACIATLKNTHTTFKDLGVLDWS